MECTTVLSDFGESEFHVPKTTTVKTVMATMLLTRSKCSAFGSSRRTMYKK